MSVRARPGGQFGNYLMTQHSYEDEDWAPSETNLRIYHDPHGNLPREAFQQGSVVGRLGVYHYPERYEPGEVDYRPTRNVVDSMFVAKAHRHVAGLLLGVAHNISMARTGLSLEPSDSLSVHSHRLASRAAERGLIHPGMVTALPRNEHDFLPPPFLGRKPDEVDVSREEIEAGRHSLREMLRQARHIG